MINSVRLNKSEMSLFHITHWKAGSQWIYNILKDAAPNKIVGPQAETTHFSSDHIEPGKIYPTLYISYEQFKSASFSSPYTQFVVIRDLRDTLISSYFSFKVSHPLTSPWIKDIRRWLNEFDSVEKGLIFLINHWLYLCAVIQDSWLNNTEILLRYEELLENDVELLAPILMRFLFLSQRQAEKIIVANRFEKISQGRKRAQEDIAAHARKAMSGEWRNYFSENVKKEFKRNFGDLLINTGYEKDHNW